ncbi:MAG: YigZ family protein [Mediterranea sp.]|nr:YigZ family protein [Mediterranea sp.]
MEDDAYRTISGISEGIYTEKRSKFIAMAIPVYTAGEVKTSLEHYQRKYFDARHICYAYMLGHERKDFRANDNGEPSGTAGKPILGQINSKLLTNILVIVIRYFGGIKLGTGGLTAAYKTAAAEALNNAIVIEKTVDEDITVMFEYPFMNDVMRIVKEEEPEIIRQSYDTDCRMTLRIRRSLMPKLRSRFENIESLRMAEGNEEKNDPPKNH